MWFGRCYFFGFLLLLSSSNTLCADPADSGGGILPMLSETKLYFPFLQADNHAFTGFAVSNFTDRPIQLRFDAYDEEGTTLYDPAFFDLDPHAQLARLSHQLFDQPGGETESGWVELTTDSPEIGSFFQFGTGNQLDGSVPFMEPHQALFFTRVYEGRGSFRGQRAETWLSIANPTTRPLKWRSC